MPQRIQKTRKKSTSPKRTDKQEILQAISVVAKSVSDLAKTMDKRFEQVDKRFEEVDKRFEQFDKRLLSMQGYYESRFVKIDERFEQMDKKFDILQSSVDGIARNLKEMQIEQVSLFRIYQGHDVRIERLEAHMFPASASS